MTLSTSLAAAVSETIRDRGREYFRSQAVAIETMSATLLTATVRGSAPYEVDLLVEGRAVHASCSCPYGDQYDAACKHIWATILAAEARGFASGAAAAGPLRLVLDDYEFDDDDDDEYDPPPPARTAAPRPTTVARVEGWQDQLAALRREVASAGSPDGLACERRADRELLYVVDVTGSAAAKRLVLEVISGSAKRTATGASRRRSPSRRPTSTRSANPSTGNCWASSAGPNGATTPAPVPARGTTAPGRVATASTGR